MSKKVELTIDGKRVTALEGENLLQVARDNGINIPGLCYHKKLSPTGACRLCVTKINGRPEFIMSCTVKVKDGMQIIAFDDEIEENRKHTLEFLLAEHNDEYDFTYPDELCELAEKYDLIDRSKRTVRNISHHLEFNYDASSPVLTYDASKCIKCFRCIKACDEVQGKNVLSFADRGLESYIVAGYGVWGESECDGCGECIQLCPTGAIVEKPHRDEIDLRTIEHKIKTTCPYCGVGCQIELHVKDNKILRSNGVEGVSPNYGRLCVKGRFGYEYVGSDDRLTTPLIKRNGKFEKASWDEALDLIARKFNETKEKYGSSALAGYSSAKCTNEDNYVFQKFVRTVFGTNNIDYCTRLCHASTVTAMLKSIGDGAGSNSIEDFEKCDLLFVTGNNMIETHPVTATFVKRGKMKGKKLIVCDPKWTPLVKYADIWLQPRLGTDVALLNGMIHVIIQENLYKPEFIKERVRDGQEAFERLVEQTKKYTPDFTEEITGVKKELIIEAAREYALASTSMIATGMGMSQQVTGTNNVFALINMMLITGQIGRDSAGIDPPRGQNNVQGATDVGCSPVVYPGYMPIVDDENRKRVAEIWNVDYEKLDAKPGLTTVEIVQAAHREEIKAMYIMGENPMISDPNLNHTEEGLRKLDFLVVQDIFPTETTELADVILPAASFAEKDGTFVNSDRRVLRVRKAINSPGEARDDWRIVQEIAHRMGASFKLYHDANEIWEEIRQVAPIFGGITYERIEIEGIQWPCYDVTQPGTGTLFTEQFNTPDGKASLNPVEYVAQKERRSEEFPFILNSGRILYQYHTSTMSKRNKVLTDFANKPYVLMHPEDGMKNGFEDGDSVRVTSRSGTIDSYLVISDEVANGELFMPWHYSESQVNRLTRDELDPMSKIAPFKLTACKVEKI